MATKLYLDTRFVKNNGTCSLKYSVSARGFHVYVGSGIDLEPVQWDSRKEKILKHPLRDNLNQLLLQKKAEIELQLLTKPTPPHSVAELRSFVENILSGKVDEDEPVYFCKFMQDFLNGKKADQTRQGYRYTIHKIKEFDKKWEKLTFDTVDYRWLTEFSKFCSNLKVNSLNFHLRNIRAVFNEAIRLDITSKYPFRKISIKAEQTKKRSLLPEQLAAIRDFDCPHFFIRRSRDIFMLMFYLIGINAKDLFDLTEQNIQNGRIEYRRAKTGRLYSIKLEPEAECIIEKYRGVSHLLFVNENNPKYYKFLGRMNGNLGKIGPIEHIPIVVHGRKCFRLAYHGIVPDLTSYWARHTWATIAHKIGIPKDVISMSLGHSFGVHVTDTYIDYDQEKVDEANRKVIDYMNSIVVELKM